MTGTGRALVAAGALTLAACSGDGAAEPAPTTSSPAPRPVVAVFGDSLAYQAWGEIEVAVEARGYRLVGEAVPGAALCDAIDPAADAARTERPAYVVVAYVGNWGSACVGGVRGAALGRVYGDAAEEILDDVAPARLVLVTPPAIADARYAEIVPAVRAAYQDLAGRRPEVTLVDGRSRLSPDGFAARLACLPAETAAEGCTAGRIRVRDPDGLHLDDAGADGYSAGAHRWAATIASALHRR
jgi:hypothetical protein